MTDDELRAIEDYQKQQANPRTHMDPEPEWWYIGGAELFEDVDADEWPDDMTWKGVK